MNTNEIESLSLREIKKKEFEFAEKKLKEKEEIEKKDITKVVQALKELLANFDTEFGSIETTAKANNLKIKVKTISEHYNITAIRKFNLTKVGNLTIGSMFLEKSFSNDDDLSSTYIYKIPYFFVQKYLNYFQ